LNVIKIHLLFHSR